MEQLMELLASSHAVFNSTLNQIGIMKQAELERQRMEVEETDELRDDHLNEEKDSTSTIESEFSFFDRLSENTYNENLDSKISNFKMNSVSIRRKDELFKRHKREQEEKFLQLRKTLEQQYPFNSNDLKFSGEFSLKDGVKNEIFSLKNEDFEKLRPETDLNDTIIDNYLKFMSICILPEEIRRKTFIFSTFFMAKLLGDQLREDIIPEKESEATIEKVQKKVNEAYPMMKRWTKRIDLFSLEYLAIPINAYKHWNCIIVVNPSALLTEPNQCKILYLDSMFERKIIFPQAVKSFLELELNERKQVRLSLENIKTYQLLVPRQTNNHDCGLYTLCYIEKFLVNHTILDKDMEAVENRCQLEIFPRSIIFTMRELLRQLFKDLLTKENKSEAIESFLSLKKAIETNQSECDYDVISEKEFGKYFQLNSHMFEDKNKKEDEIEYQCKLKFYLDCDINHYEKDQIL